jgi:hypothetical protein
MRTGLFLLVGFLLLAASVLLGRLFSSNYANAPLAAFAAFAALWLALAAANMWVGVAKAGYSVREELPIFALIFLVPAAVGALLRWRGL